jgi:oligoendopeptidase F
MSLLPFSDLAPYKPRRFVPANVNLSEWSQIAPLFDTLEKRLAEVKEADQLEHWLLDWSELHAVIEEEGARRQIAMTCHTDNADAEKAYIDSLKRSNLHSSKVIFA